MKIKLLTLIVAAGFVAGAFSPSAAQQNGAPRAASTDATQQRFIGTWKLVGTETRNAKGEVVPPAPAAANQQRTGYIIYDAAGYVAVSIMPMGRKKYAGAQPTNEEALAAMAGYAAYFGTFTIDAKEQVVTHHLQGSLNPGMATDQKRGFELVGNRLTLKPPAGANGNQARLTWEKLPDATNLSADERRLTGFWKLVSNEQRNQKGDVTSSNPGQSGYIIYTNARFMMVHMVQPNRKPYASGQPTAQEALPVLRSYTNYFGPYYIHEADGYLVHDQFGSLGMGRTSPSPQQRFYRLVGERLLLQPPPTYNPNGDTLQGTITWERVKR